MAEISWEDYAKSFLKDDEKLLWFSHRRNLDYNKPLGGLLWQGVHKFMYAIRFINNHIRNHVSSYLFILTDQKGIIVYKFKKDKFDKKSQTSGTIGTTEISYDVAQNYSIVPFKDVSYFVFDNTKNKLCSFCTKFFIVSNENVEFVKNIIDSKGQINN